MADTFNSYKNLVDLRPLIELIRTEGKPVLYERGEYLLHEGDIEKYIYPQYFCRKEHMFALMS